VVVVDVAIDLLFYSLHKMRSVGLLQGLIEVHSIPHHLCMKGNGVPHTFMATNRPSHFTVGTFGVAKKLLDLICNVGHLHEMILIEPTNISFGEIIGNCQDSLMFELGGPPGMDKVAIQLLHSLPLQ
jgi:hypothetical protein